MSFRPLENFTVVDLSHRLPGPFCGKMLSDLGARVIKIEDHKFKDPFSAGLFAEFDKSFLHWYENLNQNKEIMSFDFNDPKDQEKIHQLVINADAVIIGIPDKTRQKLKVTDEDLKLNKPFVSIELLASATSTKSMHDLNAMASAGLLDLYTHGMDQKVVAPPFLPVAGISFGHKAATDILAGYIKGLKEQKTQFVKTYLDEITRELFGLFWPQKDRDEKRYKFLHNGAYPCYALYQTKDKNYVALAAVEEKFWMRFCEIFELATGLDRFHSKDDSVFEAISQRLGSLTLDEITKKTENDDICLSPV